MTTSTGQPCQSNQQNHTIAHDNMLTKKDSEDGTWSSSGYNYLNPFVHRVVIDNPIDMAKIYVLTVILLPIRLAICIISLFLAWILACIGIYGYTLEDLRAKPISGWRKYLQFLVVKCMRLVFAAGSFQYITQKGERASPKVAPILVVAPHSSYVDSIIVVAAGPPSIVAKRETADLTLLGKIINFAQPIYVQREDPNSRQNTIREIVDRARSPDNWPQVCIFAEGTCTNRKALIKFKPGAFYPGVPVQPVLLKYPNKYDTFTWTWDGDGFRRLLWLTMAQFHNRCELEYLPVYVPSEEEKANASLYANNVRAVMARALNVPTSEYSFEDVIFMNRAKELRIPFPGDIVEIEKSLVELNLCKTNTEEFLCARYHSISNSDSIDIITFSEMIKVDLKKGSLHKLFALLDDKRIGRIDLRVYLLIIFFCKLKTEEHIHFLRAIFPLYTKCKNSISRQNFSRLMRHSSLNLTPAEYDALFFAIDRTHRGSITFDEFETYTRTLPEYESLYKKQEHIRRTLECNKGNL